ncbi:MAG: methyl-accepting chemotaxis protein [Fimbriiglobus sp.]
MNGFRWSSFQAKLFGLVAICLIGGIIKEVIHNHVLNTVKIDGQLYDKINRKKDYINDLQPPGLSLRRSYFMLLLINQETDPAKQRELLAELRRQERDFFRLSENYAEKLTDKTIRDSLTEEIVPPAREFFDIINRQYVPAMESNPQALPVMQNLCKGRIKEIFEKQVVSCEKAITLTNAATTKLSEDARETVKFWTYLETTTSVLIFLSIAFCGWLVARRIVGPTTALIATVDEMAKGSADLTKRIPVTTTDEIGQLSSAINRSTEKLQLLVTSVRGSSLQLFAGTTEIAATAQMQENTMQSLGASTNQIAAAVQEISATSAELSNTMNAVNEGGQATGKLARTGRAGLTSMGSTMQRLAESTSSISGKLNVVRQKANDINVVVTTITKVADQTNLLSINAAIEAEKAGEYGRGFLVVAREIRRLADQTAVATLDIENMVRQMQTAVSSGVMEMDKFTEEVRVGVSKVSEINGQMGQIIEEVENLNERFQVVNDSMSQQSSGTRQINDAMLDLVRGVQSTSASLKEFHAVTQSLRGSADSLKDQVSQFKVAE